MGSAFDTKSASGKAMIGRALDAGTSLALAAPVEFDALSQDFRFAFAAFAWSLRAPAGVAGRAGRYGLDDDRCKTARMAARWRSMLRDSHAWRTCSDGRMSLSTVPVPVSRSYSRRAAVILSLVRCRMSIQSARSMVPSE